jgi:hypothetical protein
MFWCVNPFFLLSTALSCSGFFEDEKEKQKDLHSIFSSGYVLVFHHCLTAEFDCFDPMLHKISLAHSKDGQNWTIQDEFSSLRGSVPDIVLRGEDFWIYALPESYLIDASSLKIKQRNGVRVFDSNNNRRIQVDPSPIIDEQGRIVLFFLEGIPGIDPARCPQHQPCTKRFLSATERKGSHGMIFDLDDGIRLNLPIMGNEFASDPDIFVGKDDLFYMYISRGQGTQVFVSDRLRGTYKETGWLTKNNGGVACGHYDKETDTFWSYTSKNVPQPWIQEIRYEKHKNVDTSIQLSIPLFKQDFFADQFAGQMMHGSPGFLSIPP